MNKKLIVKFPDGNLRFCVLDPKADYDSQLADVLGLSKGQGLCAELTEDKVLVRDYYHAETVGSIPVVAFEDTSAEVSLCWSDI